MELTPPMVRNRHSIFNSITRWRDVILRVASLAPVGFTLDRLRELYGSSYSWSPVLVDGMDANSVLLRLLSTIRSVCTTLTLHCFGRTCLA